MLGGNNPIRKSAVSNTRQQGARFEHQARRFLQQQGLKFIAANQFFPCGELDLIMQDGDFMVFVEVRQRSDSRFGDAWESISAQKQRRWIKAAEAWLNQQHKSLETCACRFDLITFDQHKDQPEPHLHWFKHFIEFNH
ncbi:YraN family protein [Testudinibacter sp. TR-2022]|uniref:YraN family protein n=1 Tax=Testudinibacter sp. TR-2022 TaxID=2585029 RepID=UPI0011194DBD|nr:YraN family protein [Testudinibacter sp. TR-2022]TNH09538.1 YraN family protein [Pasteurellaceae bacterium Phil11]TNH25140.1 YraN family protein [Testudinibacter sp. TR-2022]TNH26958.1 YraN family protein [Testudinibacter sp. TR-2022]